MKKNIDALRDHISQRLGEYRAKHVLSTEEEAVRIASVYLPENIEKVRISALLHDITKEYDVKYQLQILSDIGIIIDNVILNSPKVFHAITAAALIPVEFPEYNDEDIISAVKHHTCGHKDMSLLDMIIYLADYIEPLRSFEDCQKLREYFWSGVNNATDEKARLLHLYKTMVLSFDLTIKNLIAEGDVVAPMTFEARNAFVLKCKISEENSNE